MTPQQQVADFLSAGPTLRHGRGDRKSMCSIAAINLALNGTLTDKVPDCMSKVIGAWIIPVQEVMPLDILNSHEWRMALANAAGTGRDHEQERLAVIMDWMWGTVLPQLQPLADERGFGDEWRTMCNEKTERAAWAASAAARATAYAAARATAYATAYAAADAADAAYSAADAARDAARDTAYAAADAAYSAYAAQVAARASDDFWAADDFWSAVDPIGLLNKLNAVGYKENTNEKARND